MTRYSHGLKGIFYIHFTFVGRILSYLVLQVPLVRKFGPLCDWSVDMNMEDRRDMKNLLYS